EGPAMHDGLELKESPEGDDRPRLAVIAGPSAEAGTHPGGISQGPFRMRVLLPHGLAFERGADCLECRLLLRIEHVLERPAGKTITVTHQLQHLDRRYERCRGQIL